MFCFFDRVAARLSKAAGWDQSVFNEEAFMLSHGEYTGSQVGIRVMQYDKWVNSKVFFFSNRKRFFPGREVTLEEQVKPKEKPKEPLYRCHAP